VSFIEALREIFAFWRGKRPSLQRQIRNARLVERLADLEAEETRGEATLSRTMASRRL
jgi:hypothetical protein